jgi:hypothetical protein
LPLAGTGAWRVAGIANSRHPGGLLDPRVRPS